MPFAVERGVVRQPVLHRAADDRRGVDYPVGFGHDAAVDRAGRMVRRGAVVLRGLAHHPELLCGEPSAHLGIFRQDAPGVDVVPLASVHQPRVVVGGDGVDHVCVHIVVGGQREALRNDRADVVRAVGAVEMFVAGDDLGLDIGHERWIGLFHAAKIHKNFIIFGFALDTPARQCPNKFDIALAYPYLCPRLKFRL